MSAHDVTFIVPVFGRWDLAEPLLASLAETTARLPGARRIVWDDASAEPAAGALRNLGAGFEVFRNETNLGFGETANRAVAEASTGVVALLNSDLVLRQGWLEPMWDVLEAHPEAFAAGNLQFAADDGRLDHAGIVFHQGGHPIHFRGELSFVRRAAARPFPAVTAACCLFRRDRFASLGGFDPCFRNGFEDVDLCLRARARGWPSFVANHSEAGHHISASAGRKDHEEENRRRFLQRWQPITAMLERDCDERLAREAAARPHAIGSIASRASPNPGPDAPPLAAATGTVSTDRLRAADRRPPGPLRVLVDFARLGPGGSSGGIKVFAVHLLEAARRIGGGRLEFHLVLPSAMAAEAPALAEAGHEAWLLPPRETVPSHPRVRALPHADGALARTLQADVLYCPLGVSDFITPGIPTIAVAVDVLHREVPGALPWDEAARREIWHDRMAASSFRVQCNSAWVAGRLRELWRASDGQLFVVHNAIHDALPWKPADGSAPAAEPDLFLYPANAWPHKNHDTLLAAYRRHRDAFGARAWRLVLTGHRDAAMERVEAHAQALGLGDAVAFPGFAGSAEFARLWARTGALVFPSLCEGFGIPMLEAMHRGVPVVAGAVTSIPEVAGDAILYADPRDPCALADAMARVQTDAALRARLSEAGRRRAAAFSLEREAAKLVAAIEEAAATHAAGPLSWRWEDIP
jgi:glycosyltransferase involved in cell wall biosynthesis/GT2 family glycosyltransferase